MTSLALRPSIFSRLRLVLLAAFATLLAACETMGDSQSSAGGSSSAPQIGLYELRIYTAVDGKLGDLVARVRDHEMPLFRKHGMIPLGFFTPSAGPGQPETQRVYYILGYRDRAARDAAWTEFGADPEWRTAYRNSQVNGSLTTRIDNVFLAPAEYSPVMNTRNGGAPRVFELRTYTANPGKLEAIHARFRDHTREIFQRHGMTSVMYWRPLAGQGDYDQKMVYLMAYPSLEARNADWTAFSADAEWQRVSADSQRDGALLRGRPDSVMLTPTSFSPLR
jgi:hypothetical protein